ncbi:hypothetical protein DTO164E3_6579 [Paecilomyces variotii]|nr:hypothetical protein DTO164E3_6579 [Paecilomyces variotii]KAJ9208376.1 hypothetical protein DTO032I3_1047 [Paecilomyces variotii]KAJ9258375.1 hypothetical protein DTO207G8_1550 [Paecilomyces variotii]KAJ9264430.1 hypothetical protein DTO212C5_7156 [Paecilomyces variotii]KAJ9282170.1 hypothetical protein DTO021D3_922 [Paecilomyces variotii]
MYLQVKVNWKSSQPHFHWYYNLINSPCMDPRLCPKISSFPANIRILLYHDEIVAQSPRVDKFWIADFPLFDKKKFGSAAAAPLHI